jgi:hypothetical protein
VGASTQHCRPRGVLLERFISSDKGGQFYSEDEVAAPFSEVFRANAAPLFTSHSRPRWNNVVLATTKTM